MQEIREAITMSAEPIRLTLDQVTSKWAVLVIMTLCDDPQRFNTIKRRLGGVSQKSLTETLRKLEYNGLVRRRVMPVRPIAVEYSLTPLGWTLQEPFTSLCGWALNHQRDVESAREQFARQDGSTQADG